MTKPLKRSVAGLTMAELMLALGLLAAIVISILGLFISLLASSSKTTNQTIGHYFAQQKLEEVIATKTFPTGTETEELYAMDASHKARFAYRVHRTTLPAYNTDEGYRGGYYVEVSVYWWDGDLDEARAGQGLLYTKQGRFCYPGDGVDVLP